MTYSTDGPGLEEGQSANQQRFLMSAAHTVGETQRPNIHQVKWNTYDGIIVSEEKGFWRIIPDVSQCTLGLLSNDHSPFLYN